MSTRGRLFVLWSYSTDQSEVNIFWLQFAVNSLSIRQLWLTNLRFETVFNSFWWRFWGRFGVVALPSDFLSV